MSQPAKADYLIIEGVLHWPYQFSDEAEFEDFVGKYASEIFSEVDSVFIPKKRMLTSNSKTRTKPDGLLVEIDDKGNIYFYLVEHELSRHNPRRHVREQVFDFEEAMASEATRRPIVRDVYRELQRNSARIEQIRKVHGAHDLYLEIDHAVKEQFHVIITLDERNDDWKRQLKPISGKHVIWLYEIRFYYPVSDNRIRRKSREGEKVMAQYPSDGYWYAGRVAKIRSTGYTIKWNDGSPSSFVVKAVPLTKPVIRVAYEEIT